MELSLELSEAFEALTKGHCRWLMFAGSRGLELAWEKGFESLRLLLVDPTPTLAKKLLPGFGEFWID